LTEAGAEVANHLHQGVLVNATPVCLHLIGAFLRQGFDRPEGFLCIAVMVVPNMNRVCRYCQMAFLVLALRLDQCD